MLNSIMVQIRSIVISIASVIRLQLIRKNLYLEKGKYGEIRDIEAKQYGTVLVVYYAAYDTLDCESIPITYICLNVFTGRYEKIAGRLPPDRMAKASSNWGKEVRFGYSQSSIVLDAPWYSHKYITFSMKFPEYVKRVEGKEPVDGVEYTPTTHVFGYH